METEGISAMQDELLKQGERVLVTSATHRTINSLLEAIAEISGDRSRLAKITPFHDRSLSVAQDDQFSETPFGKSESGYVIGATPFALRTKRLSGVDFETVIIDEASQVTLPLAVVAMLAGRRYIFAGDRRQLPPVCRSLGPSESGQASIFGRLVGRGMETMLTVTYRLNKWKSWPACSKPSGFYHGFSGRERVFPVDPKALVNQGLFGIWHSGFPDFSMRPPLARGTQVIVRLWMCSDNDKWSQF